MHAFLDTDVGLDLNGKIAAMAVDVPTGMTGQFFSVGAEINLFNWIKRKVGSSEAL